jgi:glycosyltransferase involved in cell wall biosynthesis
VSLVRILRLLLRRQTLVVYYAIENADTIANLRTYRLLDNAPLFAAARLLYTYLVQSADRIAFGTDAAMEKYRGNSRKLACDQRLFLALPAPQRQIPPKAKVLVFVGSFENRKGIIRLLDAWDLCEAHGGRLILLGKGPLVDIVATWAQSRADVDLMVDPSRSTIWETLGRAKALVLFSQPEQRWREQVGLPLVEGLSFGCEIVTSAESGLANWLADNGHQVLPSDAPAGALAAAIRAALNSERSAQQIVAGLPATDGRLAADDWLTH